MIVIGVKNKTLITENIHGICPICKTNDSLQMTIYLQYVSLFWIPFVPTSKKEFSSCSSCKATLQLQYMSPAFNDDYKRIKLRTKMPLWSISGSVIAFLGLVILLFFIRADSGRVKLLVNSPQKNDIFEIRTKSGSYTLYKVKMIQKDTIYFVASKYETGVSNLSELYDKGDQGFELSIIYGIPVSKVVQMNKDGDILDVKRK